MRPPRWLGRAVRAVFLLLAVTGLLLALRGQGHAVWAATSRIGGLGVVGAFLAAAAGLGASGLVWRALLADLGSPLPVRTAGHVFFLGQLGKYLPGSVFAVAAQMELGRDQGVARSRVASAGVVFMAVLVATGLLVAAGTLPFASPHTVHRYGALLLALPVLLTCLAPPVLTRLLTLLLRALRRPPMERSLTWVGVGRAFGWALVMWGCYGAHILLLVAPQRHASGIALPVVALGGYALAWTAGFLVVVAPAGAGVREAALALALLPVLDRPAATAVAIVSRGLMTVGDLAWGGLGAAWRPVPTPIGPALGTVGGVQQLGKAAER